MNIFSSLHSSRAQREICFSAEQTAAKNSYGGSSGELCFVTRLPHPSFRTKQADFFFPLRSCEVVGLRM